jgi:hypothetical protein
MFQIKTSDPAGATFEDVLKCSRPQLVSVVHGLFAKGFWSKNFHA